MSTTAHPLPSSFSLLVHLPHVLLCHHCCVVAAQSGASSDVQAWALSPRPARAGPLKPSRARALMTAYQGSGLRLGLVKP